MSKKYIVTYYQWDGEEYQECVHDNICAIEAENIYDCLNIEEDLPWASMAEQDTDRQIAMKYWNGCSVNEEEF